MPFNFVLGKQNRTPIGGKKAGMYNGYPADAEGRTRCRIGIPHEERCVTDMSWNAILN